MKLHRLKHKSGLYLNRTYQGVYNLTEQGHVFKKKMTEKVFNQTNAKYQWDYSEFTLEEFSEESQMERIIKALGILKEKKGSTVNFQLFSDSSGAFRDWTQQPINFVERKLVWHTPEQLKEIITYINESK